MPLAMYLLIALLLVVVLIPAALDGWRRGRVDCFELIHWYGLHYFLLFGLGTLGASSDPDYAAWSDYIPEATLYALLGYVALLVGYLGPRLVGRRKAADQEREAAAERPTNGWVIGVPGLVGAMGYLVWSRVDAGRAPMNGITSLLGQLAPLFLYAWALVWLLFWDGKTARARVWWLWAVMVLAATVIIPAFLGNKTVAVTLLLIPAMALWYARRHLPWRWLSVLALLVVFVFFPLFNTYRIPRDQDPSLSAKDHLAATFRMVSDWSLRKYLYLSVGTVQRRMMRVESFAVILRDVDEKVPYLRGREWRLAPAILLVPRLFWPEKPILENDFGQRFGIVPAAAKTRIAISVPGELYWNFGLPAVLAGMLLLGLAMRWVYQVYGSARQLDPLRQALYLTLWGPIVMLDSSLAFAITGVLKTVLVISVLLWIFRRLGMVEKSP